MNFSYGISRMHIDLCICTLKMIVIIFSSFAMFRIGINTGKKTGLVSFTGPRPKRRQFHASHARSFDLSSLISSVVEPTYSGISALQHSLGVPWYLFIPVSTFLVRTITTLPLSIQNRKRAQRQQQLQPLLGAMGTILRAKLAAHSQTATSKLTPEQIHVLAAKETRRRRVELFRKYKCQVWKSLIILPSVQVPIFVILSLTIRAMCGWSVVEGIPVEAGLKTESFLWVKDLLSPDPYSVLPMTIGALSLLNVEWNALNTLNPTARNNNGFNISGTISNILRMGSLCFTVIALNAPSVLGLYWVSSNLYSLLQNVLLDRFLPLRYVPSRLGQGDVEESNNPRADVRYEYEKNEKDQKNQAHYKEPKQ